jgi:hypothetical protein
MMPVRVKFSNLTATPAYPAFELAGFPSLSGIRGAAQTAHFLDLNAVKHSYGGLDLAANLGGRISALPPERSLLQEGAHSLTVLRKFAGIRYFRVFSKDNDARPIVMSANFVCLYADQRILAHPFNLPSQRGKAAQSVGVKCEINGNDIRPVVTGASESAVAEPDQNLATFLAANLRDEHRLLDCRLLEVDFGRIVLRSKMTSLFLLFGAFFEFGSLRITGLADLGTLPLR